MAEVFAHYTHPRLKLECSFLGAAQYGLTNSPSITLGNFKRGIDSRSPTVSTPYHLKPEQIPSSPLVFELDQAFEKEEKSRFLKSVTQALELIHAGHYEKIVLSRRKKATLKPNSNRGPYQWMKQFFHPEFYGHQFLWQQGSELYLSLTPESLFELSEKELMIDALAGTTARSPDSTQDQQLWLELLNNPKERHEHQCVKQDILERLGSIQLEGLWKKEFEPLKLKHVQHIHSQYHASIKNHSSLTEAQLINTLHPTAAVGARPAQNARELLLELEGYERGPYAAPHLIRMQDRTIVIVGLRCCHVIDDEVTLYAGAGIVKGSDPEKEWLETERKCRNFL